MKCLNKFWGISLLAAASALAQQPATPASHAPAAHHVVPAAKETPDAIWADLMAGNERFVSGGVHSRPLVTQRKSLARDQHPKVAILSCSDSRVPPELLFDKSLGDLFVVRSAGNIADAIGVGSLEYAVEHLGSTVLVVMGHTGCGAVKAACSGGKMPTPNLQAIVDQIEPAVSHAKGGNPSSDALLSAAITENVHQSAADLLTKSEVLRHEVESGKLTVVKALYNLDTGEVVRIDKTKQN